MVLTLTNVVYGYRNFYLNEHYESKGCLFNINLIKVKFNLINLISWLSKSKSNI